MAEEKKGVIIEEWRSVIDYVVEWGRLYAKAARLINYCWSCHS